MQPEQHLGIYYLRPANIKLPEMFNMKMNLFEFDKFNISLILTSL